MGCGGSGRRGGVGGGLGLGLSVRPSVPATVVDPRRHNHRRLWAEVGALALAQPTQLALAVAAAAAAASVQPAALKRKEQNSPALARGAGEGPDIYPRFKWDKRTQFGFVGSFPPFCLKRQQMSNEKPRAAPQSQSFPKAGATAGAAA